MYLCVCVPVCVYLCVCMDYVMGHWWPLCVKRDCTSCDTHTHYNYPVPYTPVCVCARMYLNEHCRKRERESDVYWETVFLSSSLVLLTFPPSLHRFIWSFLTFLSSTHQNMHLFIFAVILGYQAIYALMKLLFLQLFVDFLTTLSLLLL